MTTGAVIVMGDFNLYPNGENDVTPPNTKAWTLLQGTKLQTIMNPTFDCI